VTLALLEKTSKEEYFLTQRNLIRRGHFLCAFVVSVGLDDFKPMKYDALVKFTNTTAWLNQNDVISMNQEALWLAGNNTMLA